jgi:hypothetical protein
VIGCTASIPIQWTIVIILPAVGAILAVVGHAGREIGGRKHWYWSLVRSDYWASSLR